MLYSYFPNGYMNIIQESFSRFVQNRVIIVSVEFDTIHFVINAHLANLYYAIEGID